MAFMAGDRVHRVGAGSWLAGLLGIVVLIATAGPIPSAAAQPFEFSLLNQFCESHGPPDTDGAGQCVVPAGLASDPTTGDVYVADVGNDRIMKFTAWGEFLRAWGWDVVQAGPDDDTVAPEDQFEVCVPANGDTCKSGLEGTEGSGQFGPVSPSAVAVDSAGNVYVVDFSNNRVQKFDSAGDFLLMFGGEVNKTKVAELGSTEAERNVCTAASGDQCGGGTVGVGNGQFEDWSFSSFIAIDQNSPNTVYVGDKERIQKFDTNGLYQGQISLPGESVTALAVEPVTGNLYLARRTPPGTFELSKDDVLKIGPSGSNICTLKVARPSAIAASETGEVQVFSERQNGNVSSESEIVAFDSTSCAETGRFGAQKAGFGERRSTGLATSSACGIDGYDLFVSNPVQADSFVRLYGPPPDILICPPPKVPPQIKAQHALSVGTVGASVRAQINPRFWPDTRYYVEYGTGRCSEAGCDKTALFPGSQLGAGVVKAFITTKGVFLGAGEPLTPDTTYHYRFVAESELGGAGPAYGEDPDGEGGPEEASFEKGLEGTFHTFPLPPPAKSCPNQEFRTGASAQLPNCRAYEMVSPLDKNNSDVSIPDEGHTMSAAGGDSFTFTVLAAAFGDPLSAPLAPQYISRRDPEAGWLTQSIDPPRKLPSLYTVPNSIDLQYRVFSEDLCSGWLIQYTDVPLAAGAPAGVPNLYRRHNCGPEEGSYELITMVAPAEPAPGFSEATEPAKSFYFPRPQGFCNDGATTVFSAPAKLTEDAANKDLRQVYASSNGQLHAVSVLPKGKALGTHASTGTQQGANAAFNEASLSHAVAEDCSRIFWSAAAPGASGTKPTRDEDGIGGSGDLPGPIYVRVNPLQPQSKLEAQKCIQPEKACSLPVSEAANARFLTADVKGKTAIYSTAGDLFEFDVDKAIAGEPEAATTLIAHKVKGILGASDDATRIYLVSEEALDEGALAGEANLYLYERGVGFSFIGTLSATDVSQSIPSSINLIPKLRSARVSPDGLHAAFASNASLTGYDNTDANSGQADTEAFLYDATANAGAGQLLCASCNPSGARPVGREVASVSNGSVVLWAGARLPGWISQLHPGNLLSTDGSRLFFESFEALIPRDTNGKQDVYEWERATSKSDCLENVGGELYVAAQGGCLSMISSGQSAEDAYLADASADGRDVFFATSASLLAQDFSLRDLYDARVDGGFPGPQAPAPECEGEACQGTAFNPDDPTPASSAFEGAGNVNEKHPPARCAKGKVRRKGRCVARKHKQAHKRHHRAKRASDERRVSR
jgi:DNA-binding beta-propeller fold protein YncE